MCSSPDYPYEMTLLKRYLTREDKDGWRKKKINPYINTERCFINDYGMVSVGLWLNVVKFCKEYNIHCDFSPAFTQYLNSFHMDFEKFNSYIRDLFEGAMRYDKKLKEFVPFQPREYQIKGAYMLLKYKRACAEISTSGGKTLMSFMIFKYLMDVEGMRNFVYIVPSIDLAKQGKGDFIEYEGCLKKKTNEWNSVSLYSKMTKEEKEMLGTCNVVFGTISSLANRPYEFFERFECCITDECHHAGSAASVKTILRKSINTVNVIGVTGTFPKDDTIENLTLQSYIGPMVFLVTADDLIHKEKSATPIYVVCFILDWATLEEKKELYFQRYQKAIYKEDPNLGSRLLRQEQKFVNASYARLRYIGDLAVRMCHNTLVLFGDIKGGYGKKLAEYIKENSEKDVYYIDGKTPDENRKFYKDACINDHNGNTIIVGSINTMGEGINIPNIESIFLVNTAKSERLIRQILGRGIRLSEGKDKCVMYDFVDDIRYSDNKDRKYHDNYMWKHYLERRGIYNEHKFPVYKQEIKFQ